MKNISAWAIRNPTLPIVLFVVLTLVGIVSFNRLPINLNPDVSFPIVSVEVSQPGAAPSEIETQIAQKVEGAVRSVADVRNISSRASEGFSFTMVEFQIGTPLDRALNDVRDAVSKIRADLPEGVDEPQVNRIDVEGNAIAYYAVSTTARTPEQLSWFVDNTVSKRLLAVSGVAQVSRGGGVTRQNFYEGSSLDDSNWYTVSDRNKAHDEIFPALSLSQQIEFKKRNVPSHN